jgi:hypothetical protein
MNDQEPLPRFNWKPTLTIFIVAISALIIVNYSLPFFLYPNNEQTENPDNKKTIAENFTLVNTTISVTYKNGTIETKNNISSHIINATVFEVMNETFQITYQSYPNGYLITGINGASYGWTYKVNGNSPPIACNFYVLNNNSVIAWNQG